MSELEQERALLRPELDSHESQHELLENLDAWPGHGIEVVGIRLEDVLLRTLGGPEGFTQRLRAGSPRRATISTIRCGAA